MKIRKTTRDDLEQVLALFEAARQFMRDNGNPNQWGNNHPPRHVIEDDIAKGNSYVCEDEERGTILATFYFNEGPDPTYNKIHEGSWLDDSPYSVVHRITASREVRGTASYCMQWCFERSGNLRIDTHRDNIPMQKALLKNGFVRCGIIYLESGDERIAFQKIQ